MPIRVSTVIRFATAMLWAGAGEAACAPEYPFEFHDGLIWLKVHARESDRPLNFLLDSGAGVSTVNLPTAEKLGLKRGSRVTVRGVGATMTGRWPTFLSGTPDSIPLPEKFLSVDLSELSRACQCRVDGLLGVDFFGAHTVRIDFAARKIRLLAPGSLANNGKALPLEMIHNALLTPVRVNRGKLQWVRLDTGCAAALHWVTAGARPEKCRRELSIALTKVLLPVTETDVQLGEYKFAATPTRLHEKEIFAGEAGLLGNGILSRFKAVTIDAQSGRMLLETAAEPVVR